MSVFAKAVVFSNIICADNKNDNRKGDDHSERNCNEYPPAESAVFVFDFRIGGNHGGFFYDMIFRRNRKTGSCHVFAGFIE